MSGTKSRVVARFMRHVVVNPTARYGGTPCQDWTGWKSRGGYGMFTNEEGRDVPAARWICEQQFGPLGELVPDHLCRRPSCVNVDHLDPVTVQENNHRGNCWSGRNFRKTHCLRGHEFTPENIYRPTHCPEGRGCRTCRAMQKRAYRARDRQVVV